MSLTNFNNTNGYLEIIIGPMFSGKTTQLIKLHQIFNSCNISTVVINHILDTRYHDTLLSSHDKVMIPCIKTDKLINIWKNKQITNSQVILINEAQFFDDLIQFVNQMLKENKKIYVFGLDGDSNRQKFGYILDLIPLCDKVEKLTSKCSKCKNQGIFSKRITDEKEQIVIGTNNYISVCRDCYK
jgi:thymidine kinase